MWRLDDAAAFYSFTGTLPVMLRLGHLPLAWVQAVLRKGFDSVYGFSWGFGCLGHVGSGPGGRSSAVLFGFLVLVPLALGTGPGVFMN